MAFDVREFLVNELARKTREQRSTPVPSRKRTRQRSGRSNLRRYRGQRWVQDVGGTVDLTRAIYDGPDRQGDDVRELCVVVDRELKIVSTPGAAPKDYNPTGRLGEGTYNYVGRVGTV
jgi:hypothetical protein